MKDKQIILLLQKRPADGLQALIENYHARVGGVVHGVLRGYAQDAEECIADTFVKIWKAVERVNPDTGTFRGMVLRTARNTAIDRYRQLHRQVTLPLDAYLEQLGQEDISDTVLSAEATAHLQAALLEMGQPDQEIFFRRYFLFEPVRRIGQRLGLDEVQVKNRLYRGRKRLRKRLEERGVDYEAI